MLKVQAMPNYARIPHELRQLIQWVCWRYEDHGGPKPTKVPYNPMTGKMASVTDPSSWVPFDVAVNYSAQYDGIGLVLTPGDPYSAIDLDYSTKPEVSQQQIEIFRTLNSYSERSPSGNGLHVIVKGGIPSGRKRGSIEVYSALRYITFTGDVYHDAPIMDRQTELSILWAELGPNRDKTEHAADEPERYSDHELVMRASSAEQNGQLFQKLWSGQWAGIYTSQSEADFALIDILGFWSGNHNQIHRLFLQSALGQRKKAQRVDYVNTMICRSQDQKLPPIDIAGLREAWAAVQAATPPAGRVGTAESVIGYPLEREGADEHAAPPVVKPEGLLGEAAEFFYASAPRPVAEAALCASIALMAAICGRAWNTPTGAGLNLYVCLLAETAIGKELMAGGISRLMQGVIKECKSADQFLGPAEIRSDAALLKQVAKQPSCLGFMGEFGIKLSAMCAQNASSHLTGLRSVLLDLYAKSGQGNILRPMIYSDNSKNTEIIVSPAFSLLTESTPATFYPNLDDILITQGLLPRFLVIEYRGLRPRMNKSAVHSSAPIGLVKAFAALCLQSHELQQKEQTVNVQFTIDAEKLNDTFDAFCDDKINGSRDDTVRDLWSRAHLKAMKLASLYAVGVNPYQPVITPYMWQWAQSIVERDVTNLTAKYTKGDEIHETGYSNQEKAIKRAMTEYFRRSFADMRSYLCDLPNGERMHYDKIVPYSYLQRKLSPLSAFKRDKIGPTNALKRTIQTMVDGGVIQEVDKRQMIATYGIGLRAFTMQP